MLASGSPPGSSAETPVFFGTGAFGASSGTSVRCPAIGWAPGAISLFTGLQAEGLAIKRASKSGAEFLTLDFSGSGLES